jgi:hypothetical protein
MCTLSQKISNLNEFRIGTTVKISKPNQKNEGKVGIEQKNGRFPIKKLCSKSKQ